MNGSEIGRDEILAATMAFLAGGDPQPQAALRAVIERELDAAGPAAIARLGERLVTAGSDWDYYPADPLARRIHHVLAESVLDSHPRVPGLEHVRAVAGRPVVIFANHLSYSDANILEILLHGAAADELCDRLTVVAGPKVYSSLKRRFSALCFGTIKTPQSNTVSSEDAMMTSRDVARAALRTIAVAHERLRLNDALLVFAEGTRSRTGGLQAMLAGVTRYLDAAGVAILPVGITGTDKMFPIGDDRIHRVEIGLHVGPPIDAQALRDRAAGNSRLMMDVVGLAIAAVLPLSYRGAYDAGAEMGEARRLFTEMAE